MLLLRSQADKEEARTQLTAANTELEAVRQQLTAADASRNQARTAMQELQTLHDTLVTEHAAVQAKVTDAPDNPAASM